MGDHDKGYLTLPEEPPNRPRVVDEAEEVLTSYGWQLGGTGAVTLAAWSLAVWVGEPIQLVWLLAVLGVLAFLYLMPVARAPRLAREVLRRWDELRVQRALESGGISDDPRLEVADAMVQRIVRHPTVPVSVRQTAEALVSRLQTLLTDLRRVEWLARTTSISGSPRIASVSDLESVLDTRVASILAQLAELHRTVVLRDAEAIERAAGNVRQLLMDLEAEEEVERLLADAERDGPG